MHVPTFLIMLPLVFAFGMFVWQYYQADSDNRVTDHRFLLAAASIAVGLGYLLVDTFADPSPALSLLAFLASLTLAGLSCLTRRRSAKAGS